MGNFETKIKPEFREQGTNISIDLEFLRHGDPGPEGLSIEGMEQARRYGKKLTERRTDLKKLYSSPILRARQTRDIAFEQLSETEGKLGMPRDETILSYESIETKPKFSWQEHLRSLLPLNLGEQSEDEQQKKKIEAETSAVERMFEDREYVREAASRIAYLVNKYIRMADRLNSGSQIILPKISHNSLLMSFLKETLYIIDEEGKKVLGFDSPKDIGGVLAPAESFSVKIKTDENGEKIIDFSFSNQDRLKNGRYGLDVDKIKELAAEYEEAEGNFSRSEL